MRTAEYPLPTHVIAHFSDTHLRDPADPLVRGLIDPRPNLVAALEAASAHQPEAFAFTGDLSDDGTIASYAELRTLVEPVADRIGAQVIWGNGNHDDRAAFSAELLGAATTAALDRVYHLGGLRVVCLDSTVPGKDAGEVASESLTWLAGQLASPAAEGTILALHHAPLPVVQDLAASWELVSQTALADVLSGSDVRAILAGHFHQSSFGTFVGIGVHGATSLCYTQDLSTGRGLRGVDGAQAWSLIQVHEHTVTSTVAPIAHYPAATSSLTPAESTAELARRGVRIAGA